MAQKIIKVGNSYAVTIPKDFVKETGIQYVAVKTQGKNLVISPIKKKRVQGVDEKFAKMVDEFMQEHNDVLRKLSER